MPLKHAFLPFMMLILISGLFAFNRGPQPVGSAQAAWVLLLRQQIEKIDEETPGEMGVYIKQLNNGAMLSYHAGEKWYLASTTKIPIAIVVLQEVERGNLSFEQSMKLETRDYIDGSGKLLKEKAGSKFTVADLLGRMLIQSDSTAANMLVRLVGVGRLNQRIQELTGGKFGAITDITEVRKDVYSELDPRAQNLSNQDFLELKRLGGPKQRLLGLLKKLGIRRQDLNLPSIESAFERYYSLGRNSSSLESFGSLLEQLSKGSLLTPEHTAYLLNTLTMIDTGDKRIKAGLASNIPFAQKTGTQVGRICNVGVIYPQQNGAWVVAACLKGFGNAAMAEAALAKLGRALAPIVENIA